MKYGIITQPLLNNYGGTLQNYALQQAVRKLGADVVTLDYMPHKSYAHVLRSLVYNVLLSLKGQNRTIEECLPPKRDLRIKAFLDAYVSCTHPIKKYTQKLIDDYNLNGIIVGSDQVWRPKYNPDVIEDMFVGFAEQLDIKRISYAASFGVSSWEYDSRLQKRCAYLLKKFDAVSVREDDGVSLCKQYLGVDACVVPDPTLLLEKEDYQTFLGMVCKDDRKYLYSYILNNNIEKNSYVKRLSENLNLPTQTATVKRVLECSIEQWISNIAHAEFVVTDSFHGTVFSIIFHKPFIVIDNSRRGSSRISSLLKSTGLENRMLCESNLNNVLLPSDQVDWLNVENKLNVLRNIGNQFLRKNLNFS